MKNKSPSFRVRVSYFIRTGQLEKRTEELLREIERLSLLDQSMAIKMILDKKNKEFETTQMELSSVDTEKPVEQLTDREKFKTYARALMQNINSIIRNIESEELAKVLFSFIFERPPHYDELLNFTAPIFPVFRLNEKAVENSGRTGEKTASVIGKNYAGKPKSGSKSKAVSPGEKTESRTKNKVVSIDNKAKIKDPLGSGSSVGDLWQPDHVGNRTKSITEYRDYFLKNEDEIRKQINIWSEKFYNYQSFFEGRL